MEDKTYSKVKKFINQYRMIEAGSLVVAGVSGGADSVCLLHLLWRLSKEIPYRLIVVHVDHGVRTESAADGIYVEGLCRDMEIPFYLKKVDMNGYAAEHGMSSEEAGRKLRYEAFEEVIGQQGEETKAGKIAVAHNANDRAETMLFHLFRGSGIKGLSSIQPVRDSVIRPLLCLERKEIEDYLTKWRLDYCTDSTNEEDTYTRNKIRHHILPYAEQEICLGAVMHMGELADILSDTEQYLDKRARQLYGTYVEEIALEDVANLQKSTGLPLQGNVREQTGQEDRRFGLRIQGTRLLREDSVMYKRVLLLCMERITPHRKDITGQHIAALAKLMAKKGSKEMSLPYGIRAYKEYDSLILYREKTGTAYQTASGGMEGKEYAAEYEVKPPVEISVPGEGVYSFILLENKGKFLEKQQNILENRYTKWFDYDKITTTLLLRTRRQGDYLTIDGALHTKSVKQYMINEKIPKIRRDSIHMLADGSHILWIPGYRISECYKVDESTKRILQVQLRGGSHGRTNRSVIG